MHIDNFCGDCRYGEKISLCSGNFHLFIGGRKHNSITGQSVVADGRKHTKKEMKELAILRILNSQGDATLTWDPAKVEAGDPEALAAVEEAGRIFNERTAKGATALAVAPGRTAERLEKFDPQVEETIVVPQIVGG